MARALDRRGQLALVLGTIARLAPRPDLAAIGQETPQPISSLVVNVRYLFLTEEAGLATPGEPAPPSSTTLSSSS